MKSPTDRGEEPVKYHRPIPSGRSRPFTQRYGQLLADFNKIAQLVVAHRLVVLVTDDTAAQHIRRSGRDLLPLDLESERRITSDAIRTLPDTAVRAALSHGDWTPLEVSLSWRHSVNHWSLLAWSVIPSAA